MTDYSFSNLTELFELASIYNKNNTKEIEINTNSVSVYLLYDNKYIYMVECTVFGTNPQVILRCEGENLFMSIENIEKRNSAKWEKWIFNKDGLERRCTQYKTSKALSKAEQIPVLKFMFTFSPTADVSERWGIWTWKNGSLICEKRAFSSSE